MIKYVEKNYSIFVKRAYGTSRSPSFNVHRKSLLKDIKNNMKTLDNLERVKLSKYNGKKKNDLKLSIETARLNMKNSLTAAKNRSASINDFTEAELDLIRRGKTRLETFNDRRRPIASIEKKTISQNYRKGTLHGRYEEIY